MALGIHYVKNKESSICRLGHGNFAMKKLKNMGYIVFPKTFFAGVITFIIGFFLMLLVGLGYVPDFLFDVGILIGIAGVVLWALGEFKLTQKYKLLIAPIIYTVIWNLGVVYFFLTMDKDLFNTFVSDFGLTGTWSLFTLNMHANISGTVKTYPYINSHVVFFLMCVVGNIFLSAVYMIRIYRNADKLSIPPPP
jgi:hypothetical protein